MRSRFYSALIVLVVFFFARPQFARADLPPAVIKAYREMTTNLAEAFWFDWQRKLEQINVNYGQRINSDDNVITFLDLVTTDGCRDHRNKLDANFVGRITSLQKIETKSKENPRLKEKIEVNTYFGCKAKETLIEFIRVSGTDLEKRQFLEIYSGKRQFYLADNEDFKTFIFSDGKIKFGRVLLLRQPDRLITEIYAGNSKVVRIIAENINQNVARIIVFRHTFSLGYENFWGRFSPNGHLIRYFYADRPERYVLDKGSYEDSSKSQFAAEFKILEDSIKGSLNRVFAVLIAKLPKTEVASSGLANQRLITELDNYVKRLRRNPVAPQDSDFVSKKLQELIEDIKKELLIIKDFRPDQ